MGTHTFVAYNIDSIATRKYKGSELYLLPPTLFPHEPLDNMDKRYLNFSFSSIPSPLKQPMAIELYNDTHFSHNSTHISKPSNNRPSSRLDEVAFKEHQAARHISSAGDLFQDSKECMSLIKIKFTPILNDLTKMIDMNNKLFFIQYAPDNSLRRRWYLIQVDMESTMDVNPSYATDHRFWCVFLAKYPDDSKKGDEFSLWWPDWYNYSRCPTTDYIVYGDCIMIKPNVLSSSKKFVQWATMLPLDGSNNISLLGPITFETIDAHNRVRNKVHRSNWNLLIEACATFGIMPPTIGVHHPMRTKLNGKKRKGM